MDKALVPVIVVRNDTACQFTTLLLYLLKYRRQVEASISFKLNPLVLQKHARLIVLFLGCVFFHKVDVYRFLDLGARTRRRNLATRQKFEFIAVLVDTAAPAIIVIVSVKLLVKLFSRVDLLRG